MTPVRPAPTVSVITIFFNAERFLSEALASVVRQTYTDWELLLVDDGSTDGSTRVAHAWARRYAPTVRYLEHKGHKNRGTSVSRNLGVREARGKYVAFLDADDVWLPGKLERQTAILASHPDAAMVYGRPQVWYSWTGRPDDRDRDIVEEKAGGPLNALVQPPALLPLLLRDACVAPFSSSMMLRRAAVARVGGFDERIRVMFEDLVLTSKVCLEAPVFVSGECWHRYRRHEASCCSVAMATGRYEEAWRVYLEWLAGYLWRRGIRAREVWPVIEQELGAYRHPLLYRLSTHHGGLRTRARTLAKSVALASVPGPVRHWLADRVRSARAAK